MGLYINNVGDSPSKHAWCNRYGTRVAGTADSIWEMSGIVHRIPVAWVDNYSFQAIAVAFSERELARILRDDSGRPIEIYLIPQEDIQRVCPEAIEMIREVEGYARLERQREEGGPDEPFDDDEGFEDDDDEDQEDAR